ncbi:MAG: Methylcrotonyl-CoA carboxylase carboxyl transferase subunit, partial [Rhizobacter sp.]|nr:Methylcrotonyl-CoA carboxylase carboxyl transferase subunit [Rhizobacter sp.]
GFHPRFCFSWPNAKTAVMGGEQAAKTMVIVTEAAMKRKGEVDQDRLDDMERKIIERFDSQMSVFTTSAHVLDDGVIDPRDTRSLLSKVLSICRDADLRKPQAMQFSVARP